MRKHIKSILCLIFALVLSICAISLISNNENKVILAESEDRVLFVGSGTKEDPIIISTAEELLLLSDCVNNNKSANGVYYSQMYYELGKDIELNKRFMFHYDAFYKKVSVYRNNNFKFVIDFYGKTFASNVATDPKTPESANIPAFWTPIGDGINTFFSGSFDGKGYTISGLFYDEYLALVDDNLENDAQYDIFALFGGLKSVSSDKVATVKNLNIENSLLVSSNDIASIVGNAIGNVKIQNCSSNATIFSSANAKNVAGLVVLNEGELLNSSYKGVINGAKVGGIVNTNRGTVDNCLIVANFIFDDDNESVNTNIGAVCYINSSKLKNCYYLYNTNLVYLFRNNSLSNTSSIGYFTSNNIVTPVEGFTLSYGTDLLTSLQSWVEDQEDRFYVWDIKENEYIPYLLPILTDVKFLDNVVVFDSLPHTINISNLKANDVVKYSLDNINFSTNVQTETFVKDTATIIYASVERSGYAVLKGSATIKIDVAVINFPTLLGEYVYNEELQTANLQNITDFAIEISNNSRVVAGTQDIVCKLKYPNSTQWQDGTTTDYMISWEIKKLAGYIYDIKKLDKEYDGNPVSITSQDYSVKGNGRIVCYYKLKNENDASYTMVAPQNAGNYIIKVTMQETENYAESSATKEFTISKCKLQKPKITKYNSYNGKLQFAEIETNGAYQILNDSATEVGTYYAYVVLKDTKNYEWEDGTNNILYLSWKILGSKPLSNALTVAITILVVLAVEIGAIYIYWCVINKKDIKELVSFVKFDKKHSAKIKTNKLVESRNENNKPDDNDDNTENVASLEESQTLNSNEEMCVSVEDGTTNSNDKPETHEKNLNKSPKEEVDDLIKEDSKTSKTSQKSTKTSKKKKEKSKGESADLNDSLPQEDLTDKPKESEKTHTSDVSTQESLQSESKETKE